MTPSPPRYPLLRINQELHWSFMVLVYFVRAPRSAVAPPPVRTECVVSLPGTLRFIQSHTLLLFAPPSNVSLRD